MSREELLQQLAAHRTQITAFGVRSLALFGSVARDEAGADSDIDLMVEFDGHATFDRYMDLRMFLEDVLERRIDLVTRNGVRPQLRSLIDREAIVVA